MPARELFCDGDHCSVWMTPKVRKAFGKAEARFRARCEKLMKRFAARGPEVLIETQFKFQERLTTGGQKGAKVAIYAFKAYQLRVYGGYVPGKVEFVCTEIEVTKKQDEADRKVLERSARHLGEFV